MIIYTHHYNFFFLLFMLFFLQKIENNKLFLKKKFVGLLSILWCSFYYFTNVTTLITTILEFYNLSTTPCLYTYTYNILIFT